MSQRPSKKEKKSTPVTPSAPKGTPTIYEKIFDVVSFIITWGIRGIIGACLIGFLGNWLVSKYERSSLSAIGDFVEVGEKHVRINYYCAGSSKADESTIFLVPGSDGVYLSYGNLIQRLAENRRVCTYDRPGRLFSEGRPNNTDAAFNVEIIHRVITAAVGDSPVVLVGHSMGALLAACYSLEHPTKGLVLLDAMGTSSQELVDELTEEPKQSASWTHVMTIIGVLRTMTYLQPAQFSNIVPPEWAPLWMHCINQPDYWNLGEIELWSPLQSFLMNKTRDGAVLKIPVLNIRSSYFGPRGDEVWQSMWKAEALFTSKLSVKPLISVVIPGSDHTFSDKHNEVAKQIEKYLNMKS